MAHTRDRKQWLGYDPLYSLVIQRLKSLPPAPTVTDPNLRGSQTLHEISFVNTLYLFHNPQHT